jgi:hypothetical protein
MRALLVACTLMAGSGVWSTAGAAACTRDNSALDAQFERLRQTQPEQVKAALDAIDGFGRKLLALRSYLRQQNIAARWSWTQAQIDAYERSPEYQTLLAEIAAIRVRFESANPGYQLYANTDVRSLDQQIERWNENREVASIAAALQAESCTGVNLQRREALRTFLLAWQPPARAPLAAPGLSLHGRARAIDFQIHQGSRVVAGPETARIETDWVRQGWSNKLARAIHGASRKFDGPLRSPDEPWHYEYDPQQD